MFALYFAASAVAIVTAFSFGFQPHSRLYLMFFVGLTVFGVFGSFTFYLPELFPMHLRGTGAGFCYNAGRVLTAAFPFAISMVGKSGANPLHVLRWAAILPVIGLLLVFSGLFVETKAKRLAAD